MSILAEQVNQKHELSKEFLQEGFSYASKAGELLLEVQNLVGAENFETWLSENCSAIQPFEAKKYMKLSSGKKVTVTIEVLREQENQVEPGAEEEVEH